jgi:voltage-gated potassium channel
LNPVVEGSRQITEPTPEHRPSRAFISPKQRVYEVLNVVDPDDPTSRVFEAFILSLIALNVFALVVQTVQSVYLEAPAAFQWFESVSVVIFSIEYALRLWCCTASPRYADPIRGRIRFAITPLAIVDLVAILPFYVPFFSVNLLFIRVVRIFRFFRVAKAARYSKALRTFGAVISKKREQLVVALLLLFLAVIFASALMYFVENQAQPEEFSSIPATMWWAVETLTTVGYGDVCPVTVLGKFMATVLAILGIAVFALPTAILGAGFVEEFERRHETNERCPHCGGNIGPRPER